MNESDYRLAIDTLIPALNANIYSSGGVSEKRHVMSFVTETLLFQSAFGGSTTMQLRTFKTLHDTGRLENVLKSLFDGNDEMLSMQGYFGNDPSNLVNLNVIVGKIEKSETTISKESTDENMMEIVGLDIMGGSHINDPNIRIPCVLDAICPSEISEQDSSVAVTLRLAIRLRLDKLPFNGVYDASVLNFAIGDNTFSTMGNVVSRGIHLDTRNVNVKQLTSLSDHVDTLRGMIRDIGSYTYSIRIHGNRNANLMGALFHRMHLVVEIPEARRIQTMQKIQHGIIHYMRLELGH